MGMDCTIYGLLFCADFEVKENLIKKAGRYGQNSSYRYSCQANLKRICRIFYIKNKVLLMGSAMGNIEIDKSIIDQMSTLPYEFIIIAGKNQELYEKLISYKLPHNVELVGFTKDIAKYMKSCDLLVTKPEEQLCLKRLVWVFRCSYRQLCRAGKP